MKGEEVRAKDEAYFTLHMCGCHAENADGRRKTADSTRVGGLARTLKGRNRMGRTIVFIRPGTLSSFVDKQRIGDSSGHLDDIRFRIGQQFQPSIGANKRNGFRSGCCIGRQ